MAKGRVFSWCLKSETKTIFAYLAKQENSETIWSPGYYIKQNGNITDKDKLRDISEIVGAYSLEEYTQYFTAMTGAVHTILQVDIPWNPVGYYYNVDGDKLVMLTAEGTAGNKGEKGEKGDQGIQGERGKTGMAGNGRNVMAYCGLTSGLTPTRENILGGKFYPNKWEIDYPSDPVGFPGTTEKCVWGDSNEFGIDKVVWMTNANFPSSETSAKTESVLPIEREDNQGNVYTWATPIQISGPKGDNGADGENIEFIYYRTTSRDEELAPDRPLDSPQIPDYLPEVYVGGVDQGVKWTDHPLGISEEYKVEYMCTRHRDEDKIWGEWSEVALWASWGEDGNDGDGIEYIFCVTSGYNSTDIAASVPNAGMVLALENGNELVLADHWQDPEIYDYFAACGVTRTNDGVTVVPNGKFFYGKTGATDTAHDSIFPWTDDPSDVSEEEPYEWVSIRRRKWIADEDKSLFGPFGEPKLWAHWGKNGEKGDDGTSLDLKTRKDTLGHLLQSLYDETLPDKWDVPKNGYTYAIGEGDTTKMFVFMQLDDSVTADTRYTEYQPPLGNWNLDDDAYLYYYWKYYEKDEHENQKFIGYFWFSYCGLFKGDDGLNAYMHMKYGREYREEYGNIEHYVVQVEGKDVDICFTVPTPGGTVSGETPGPYMAVYCDNVFDDRGELKFYCGLLEGSKNLWEKFRGDDGQSFGQEQIFTRGMSLGNIPPVRAVTESETGHGYEVGEMILDVYYKKPDAFNKVDWVPSQFTDVPMGIVNGTQNFEWVCTRRLLEDGTWSFFSPPALYNEAADSANFQIEYSTWTGETTPVLANASEYTGPDGQFDENGWRLAHAQYGPWSDVSSNETVWMATAMYLNKNNNPGTKEWSDWQITRCKGIVGKAGNGRNIVAYCITDSAYTVTRANLSGGAFYPNRWDITFPTDPTGHVEWQDSNETSDKTKRVWMTNADFPSSTGDSETEVVYPIEKEDSHHNRYTWATPICITGENGENGADGESIEFIYYLAQDRDAQYKPDRPNDSPQEPDYCPWVYINGHNIGVRWTDNPQGISEDKKVEYMCSRTKDAEGIWSEWSQVNMWSSWGEDGIDGDGVEYIFCVTKDLSQSSLNAIKAILPSTTSHGGELADHWQDPEIWDYIESNSTLKSHYSKKTATYSGWTDDPADVSPDEPYEWVAIRRKKYTESVGDAIFYEFEEPALWARWSDDGDEVHTEFAFTLRQEGDDISNYTVSGFKNTEPVELLPTVTKNDRGVDVSSTFKWTDAPSAWTASMMAASGAPIVWMVTGVFRKHHNAKTGEDTWTQEGSWSNIKRMTDTDNFETMYSSNDGADLVDIRTITGFTKLGEKIEPGWEARANANGWYDDAYQCPNGVVWMATITGSNGKFNDQDWQQFKVKGEKGNPGDDGVSKFNSIVFKRTNTKPATPTGGSYSSPVPSGWEDTVPTGSSILWMSSRLFTSNGDGQASAWSEPSQATDNEYIDYEWNKYYTTEEAGMAHLPTKTSPNASQSNPDANYWWDEPIQGAILMAVRQVSNGQYVGNWQVSKIKGENGSTEDLQYIKDIFPNVDASADTATLRGFLGVMSGNSDVVAFLNGGSGFTDSTHGTLMMAAGVEGLNNANNAKFRVYEDGTVCAKDAEIDGSITAATGFIGGISITPDGISGGGEEGNGFSFGNDGSVNINNKNVIINNNGISFLNNDSEPVLTVLNSAYSSLTQFIDSMGGQSINTQVGYVAPAETRGTSNAEYVYTESFIDLYVDAQQVEIATFTVPAGCKMRLEISPGGINIRGWLNNDLTTTAWLDNYGSKIQYYFPIVLVYPNGSEDLLDSINGDIDNAYEQGDIRGQSFTYIKVLNEGTYKLCIGNMFDGYHCHVRAHVRANDIGYGPALCRFTSELYMTNLVIKGTPANSGTEIFRNGIAVRNNDANYLFVATPDATAGGPNKLVISVKSNGKGFTLDENGWHWEGGIRP